MVGAGAGSAAVTATATATPYPFAPTAQPFGGAALPEVPLLSKRAGRLVAQSYVSLATCACTAFCGHADHVHRLQKDRDNEWIRGMRDIDPQHDRVPQGAIEIRDYLDTLTAIAEMCQREELTFEAQHPLYPDQVLRLPRLQVLRYLGITFACQPCKSEEKVIIELWRLQQYVLGYETQATPARAYLSHHNAGTRIPEPVAGVSGSKRSCRNCQSYSSGTKRLVDGVV